MEFWSGPAYSAKDAARWEAVRRRGRRRYVLLTGIVKWALPVGILSEAAKALIGDAPGSLLVRLPIALVTNTVAGILFGRSLWWMEEKRYRRWAEKRDSMPPFHSAPDQGKP